MALTPKGTERIKSNFTSKYLSPCRTIGLKRKSKSPNCLTPKSQLSDINTVNQITDNSPQIFNIASSSESEGCLLNKSQPDVMNILSSKGEGIDHVSHFQSPVTSRNKKYKLSNNLCDSDEYNQVHSKENIGSDNIQLKSYGSSPNVKSDPKELLSREMSNHENCQSEMININEKKGSKFQHSIEDMILRIDSKFEKVTHLQQSLIYSRKHDKKKLVELSETWKRVCIDALERLHKELVNRGDSSVSLHQLIKHHSIPSELLSFNEDTEEFI